MTDLPQNITEFKKKYGTRGVGITVKEFIGRAPEFKGDETLAKMLGEMMGDLQNVLGNETESAKNGPISGHDCASNVLAFTLHVLAAQRHLRYDGDKRDTVRIVAEILDSASSEIAAAVTVCELGRGGTKRSVEMLALASTFAKLANTAQSSESEHEFMKQAAGRLYDMEFELNQLVGDLTENDFR